MFPHLGIILRINRNVSREIKGVGLRKESFPIRGLISVRNSCLTIRVLNLEILVNHNSNHLMPIHEYFLPQGI